MTTSRKQGLKALLETVTQSRGALTPSIRGQIVALALRPSTAGAEALPPLLATVTRKIAERSYTVTDSDISALRADGCSEDAIFEAIVCAAVGAGMRRFDYGLAALSKGE